MYLDARRADVMMLLYIRIIGREHIIKLKMFKVKAVGDTAVVDLTRHDSQYCGSK